jgi:hypothetical protein
MISLLTLPLSGYAKSFCTKSSSRDLDLRCDIEETDLYFGATGGRVRPAAKSFGYQENSSVSTSLGVLIGKRLNDKFSFETQYLQGGRLYDSASANVTEVNIFSFTGLGRYPLDPARYISLYGRLGWGVSYVTIQNVGNNWHGDLTYGGGVELALGSTRDLYLRIGVDEYNTGALSVLVPGQPVPRDKLDIFSISILINL